MREEERERQEERENIWAENLARNWAFRRPRGYPENQDGYRAPEPWRMLPREISENTTAWVAHLPYEAREIDVLSPLLMNFGEWDWGNENVIGVNCPRKTELLREFLDNADERNVEGRIIRVYESRSELRINFENLRRAPVVGGVRCFHWCWCFPRDQ